jgi:hypothetical protein
VITTKRVYKDLEREGFVRTRSGRSTVVVEIPEEKAVAYLREPLEEAVRDCVDGSAGRTQSEGSRELRNPETALENPTGSALWTKWSVSSSTRRVLGRLSAMACA